MRRILSAALLAASPLFSGPFLSGSLLAQNVSSIFPPSSFATLDFAGLAKLEQMAPAQGFIKLLHGMLERMDPEARERAMGQLMGDVQREMRQMFEEIQLSPADLRALLSQPMAFGLGRMDFFDGSLLPSFGVAFQAPSGDLETARGWMAKLEASIARADRLTVDDFPVSNGTARRLQHPSAQGSIVMGAVGGVGLGTNSEALFSACADRAAKSGTTSGNVLLSGFLNTKLLEPVIPLVANFLPYGFEDLPTMLGVESLDGIHLRSEVDGDGSHDSLRVAFGGPTDGLLKIMMAKPASLDATRYCGENTVLFGSMALDTNAMLDKVQEFIARLPESLQREMHSEMTREFEREMGMSPEQMEVLVRSFGGNIAMAVEMHPNQPIPTMMLFVDLANEDMVRGMLSGMEGETGTEWKQIEAKNDGEVPIRYTTLDMDGLRLNPGYAFREGQLIIGSDLKKLRSALRRPMNDGPTLADVRSFQDGMQRFSGASVFVHTRMDRATEMGWPMAEGPLRGLFEGDEAQQMGLSMDMVPTAEEMAKALGAATSAVTVDASGLRIEQRTNVGLATILCLLGVATGETLDSMIPSNR